MARSLFTIDLGAVRHNARTLLRALDGAELWAVVKADGYGHGAADVGRAVLEEGAAALCVAAAGEGVQLRSALPGARILVLGPVADGDLAVAREAQLELCAGAGRMPPLGVPVHVKLDTGMGRWGLSELEAPGSGVVGLMSHFAAADADPAFTQVQLDRFLKATAPYAALTRHIANSAAALRLPAARLDAARCGIALYGISPFGGDPAADGLRPALRWQSEIALVKELAPGESTGYGRRFVADRPTRIGIVPVGYADGFRRDMTGTTVLVDGEPVAVVGTVSMDALAVALPAGAEAGSTVMLVGGGAPIEQHARVSGTIGYEIACGLVSRPPRAQREVVDD